MHSEKKQVMLFYTYDIYPSCSTESSSILAITVRAQYGYIAPQCTIISKSEAAETASLICSCSDGYGYQGQIWMEPCHQGKSWGTSRLNGRKLPAPIGVSSVPMCQSTVRNSAHPDREEVWRRRNDPKLARKRTGRRCTKQKSWQASLWDPGMGMRACSDVRIAPSN